MRLRIVIPPVLNAIRHWTASNVPALDRSKGPNYIGLFIFGEPCRLGVGLQFAHRSVRPADNDILNSCLATVAQLALAFSSRLPFFEGRVSKIFGTQFCR
jgi:hypothetical protein